MQAVLPCVQTRGSAVRAEAAARAVKGHANSGSRAGRREPGNAARKCTCKAEWVRAAPAQDGPHQWWRSSLGGFQNTPSNLAAITPGSVVAHRIQAGTRSTAHPSWLVSLTLTRERCGMAGCPLTGGAGESQQGGCSRGGTAGVKHAAAWWWRACRLCPRAPAPTQKRTVIQADGPHAKLVALHLPRAGVPGVKVPNQLRVGGAGRPLAVHHGVLLHHKTELVVALPKFFLTPVRIVHPSACGGELAVGRGLVWNGSARNRRGATSREPPYKRQLASLPPSTEATQRERGSSCRPPADAPTHHPTCNSAATPPTTTTAHQVKPIPRPCGHAHLGKVEQRPLGCFDRPLDLLVLLPAIAQVVRVAPQVAVHLVDTLRTRVLRPALVSFLLSFKLCFALYRQGFLFGAAGTPGRAGAGRAQGQRGQRGEDKPSAAALLPARLARGRQVCGAAAPPAAHAR